MPDYIDIHAHMNFAAYDADRPEVIRRSLDSKVWIINVGTQIDTSKYAIELAHEYDQGVYAVVGVHPVHTSKSFHDGKELGQPFDVAQGKEGFMSRGEAFDRSIYRTMAGDPKVVGIGECGLDYYRLDEESIKKQKEVFIQHIELANQVSKPLMLHIRNGEGGNAYKDALEILKTHAKGRGDVHFFAGDYETAKQFFDLGFMISFTGVITFAKEYAEVVKNAPLDMIMSETDCPYVTPVPYRGKRNEPLHVREVVAKIASIKNLPLETVKTHLVQNAFSLFNLQS